MIKYITILLIALTLILSACGGGSTVISSNTTPITQDAGKIPGATLCDANTQKNVINALNIYESVAKTGCASPKIINTEVTQQPASSGVWIERWTLNRCGVGTVAYKLTFTPDPKGAGAGFSLELEKQK